jgi:hypothetical protein
MVEVVRVFVEFAESNALARMLDPVSTAIT